MKILIISVLLVLFSKANATKSQSVKTDLDQNGYTDLVELVFNSDSTLAGLRVSLLSLDQNDDVLVNKIFDRSDLFTNDSGFNDVTFEDLPKARILVSLPFLIDGQTARKTLVLKVENQKVLISSFTYYQVNESAEQFNCNADLETGIVEQSVFRPVAVPKTIKFDTSVRNPELSNYNDSVIPEYCKRRI